MTGVLLGGAALTVLVLAAVLYPLLRGMPAAPSRAEFDGAVYRDQLRELERDVARGMIGPAEAAAARLEIQRRLLGRDDTKPPASGPPASSPTGRSLGLALMLGVLVASGAGGFYLLTGAPGLPGEPIASRAADPADLAMQRAIAELEARLEISPGDGDGWLLLAQASATQRQWPRSVAAYRRALALLPATPDLLASQAEAITLAASGTVTPAAQEGFAKVVAQDPEHRVARFYLATADAQAGRATAAIAAWQQLAAELPADSPIRGEIARRIADAARAAGIATPALAAAAEDAATPQARDAMIRDMVERLAARLAAAPDDVEGWLRLGRAYSVLGEADKSASAYATAARLRPDDLAIPLAEAQALLDGLAPAAAFPPRALELLRRVAASDPNQPTALWHLGVEAAKRGAASEAAGYWQRLLAVLPEAGEDATLVRAALAALGRR